MDVLCTFKIKIENQIWIMAVSKTDASGFDTAMLKKLVLYFDFEGAKKVYVLKVLIWVWDLDLE